MIKKTGIWTIFLIFILMGSLNAAGPLGLSKGQTVYVPAYSHIYIGNKASPYLLTVTLSIRNIDPSRPITLQAVEYYGSQGKLIKQYLGKPKQIAPMAADRHVVLSQEKEGGSGANFIVKWSSDTPVNPPIIESVMIGTQSQQGISFTSRGQEIFKE